MNGIVELFIECEIEEVTGDAEHLWARPLSVRYMVPKESVLKERWMGANEEEGGVSEATVRAIKAREDKRQKIIAGATGETGVDE